MKAQVLLVSTFSRFAVLSRGERSPTISNNAAVQLTKAPSFPKPESSLWTDAWFVSSTLFSSLDIALPLFGETETVALRACALRDKLVACTRCGETRQERERERESLRERE